MRFLRRVHLYLGCFFAPLLLFFVSTGWYQTLDEERLKQPGDAETLGQKLRVVHTDQVFPQTGARRQVASPTGFKVLVSAMSVALIVTTLLGVVLAFKSVRVLWPVWLSLALGLAVPVMVLWLSQRRR
jgi:hypothetical protein